MFTHNIDPVLVDFSFKLFGMEFPIEIRYYGLIYALGFLAAYLYLMYITSKKEIPNFKPLMVENFMIGLVLCMIIGARIFHVFVYDFGYYANNIWEIFMIWRGGLSFHGGLLFSGLWVYGFSKYKKVSFFRITDALVIPVALFLSLGRIANFINGELRGIVSDSVISVVYADEGIGRLPTQLFESAKNFFIFLVLIGFNSAKNKIFRKYVPGLMTAIFLITYGFIRFFIEFLKEGKKVIGALNIAHILSMLTVAVGVYMYFYLYKKTKISKE